MNCPNCNNQLNSQNYCHYCNRELIIINDRILDKEIYEEVKNIHNQFNTLIDSAINLERSIDENINNQDFYNSINLDENKKTYILNEIDNAYNSIMDFKEKLDVYIINDKTSYDYLKSMDDIFGNCDEIINTLNNHINYLKSRIIEYKMKINTNTQVVVDEDTVKKIHDTIDEYNNMILNVKNNVENVLGDQESLDELRYDENTRVSIKNSLKEVYASYDAMINEVNILLNDEYKLNYVSYYDNKYGNIYNKATGLKNSIEESKENLKKIERYIESIEKAPTKIEYEYNHKRRIDL